MADDAPAPSNPIWWFLAIIVGLFIIWMFTGGPQRYEETHPQETILDISDAEEGDAGGDGDI